MGVKWVAKAIIQKSISILPNKERVNFLFQKHVTKAVLLTDQHFEWKITHARDHVNYFLKYASSKSAIGNSAVLELGTGWYPIIPIALYLNGFESCTSIDIQSWMNVESQLETVRKFKEWDDKGKLAAFLPNRLQDRWQKLVKLLEEQPENVEQFNQAINLETHLIDARATAFKSGQFDFICSNNTFEHIPKPILVDILKEFKRLLKGGGIMSHFIDMTDHFAHFDSSITDYNFLQFSDKQWQLIDNSIQPQNRLRWADYLAMYTELGIHVLDEETRPGDVNQLKKVKLHADYAKQNPEAVAISHGYLVSN